MPKESISSFIDERSGLARSLYESPVTGAVLVQDDIIKAVNPAFERLTGRSSQQLVGISPGQLLSGADENVFREATKSGESPGSHPVVLNVSDGRGGYRSAVCTFSPASLGSGKGILALFIESGEAPSPESKSREEQLLKTTEGTLQAIEKIVEMKDPYITGHQRRVARLSYAIAKCMSMPEEEARVLRMAALVHDVGKVSIPIQVLAKPMRLSEDEYSIVRMHPLVGYDILKDIEHLSYIGEIILQHHERMDGSGYPSGLSGSSILPEARIICVADVVEAMVSQRPHRPAMGIKDALEEITKHRDEAYDPDVEEACIQLNEEENFSIEQERA